MTDCAEINVNGGTGETLHSGNCGLIIMRVGQAAYEFRDDACEFARVLQEYNNKVLYPDINTLLYEEILGTEDRLHWLIHMKAPNDYGKVLEMVETDQSFQDISGEDRLSAKGGGNWERMFEEASFRESVIVPQHGLTPAGEDAEMVGLFAAPAQFQVPQRREEQLHSANAHVIIHRTAQVKYGLRKEGRQFAFEWQDYINRILPGVVTIFLYEETWGTQDRIHWLIHLRELGAYREIMDLETVDDEFRKLLAADRIAQHKGGGTWGRMFVDGTIHDTVLVPLRPRLAAE